MIGYRLLFIGILAATPFSISAVDSMPDEPSPPDSPPPTSSGIDPGEGTGSDFIEPGLIYTPPSGNAVDFTES